MRQLALLAVLALSACASVRTPDWNAVLHRKADAFNAGGYTNTDPKPTVQPGAGIAQPGDAARRALKMDDGTILLVR